MIAWCGHEVDAGGSSPRIGFREACRHCGSPLHICRNCRFYDPGVYNDCREPQAERIVDKERANRCEYFVLQGCGSESRRGTGKDDPRSRLEELFRKT